MATRVDLGKIKGEDGGQFTKSDVLNWIYPVGSIYMSVNNVNPNTFIGGTWVAWGSGRVPVGISPHDVRFNKVEQTGGEATVFLKTEHMPAHSHTITGSSVNTDTTGSHTHKHANEGAYGFASFNDNANKTGVGLGTQYTYPAGYGVGTASAGEHSHTVTAEGTIGETGNGLDHNNLQPYIVCYMWKRTA